MEEIICRSTCYLLLGTHATSGTCTCAYGPSVSAVGTDTFNGPLIRTMSPQSRCRTTSPESNWGVRHRYPDWARLGSRPNRYTGDTRTSVGMCRSRRLSLRHCARGVQRPAVVALRTRPCRVDKTNLGVVLHTFYPMTQFSRTESWSSGHNHTAPHQCRRSKNNAVRTRSSRWALSPRTLARGTCSTRNHRWAYSHT